MNSEKVRKLVTVVCACIRRDGGKQVLLSMRHAPGVDGLDGKWELPGGKIEFGETPDQAIVREIREEIGVEITPLRLLPYLHTNVWEYNHASQHVVLAGYECELKHHDVLIACADARWFDVDAIDFSTTLPGTHEFIELALKADWFDRLCIRFEYPDPTSASTRHFVIAAQPSLFSRYGLVRYWWGGAKHTRLQHEQFDSPREMDERIFEIVRTRLSDGYRITDLEGATDRYGVLARILSFARARHAIVETSRPN